MDAYVKLAQNALKEYLNNNRLMALPADLPEEMLSEKAGVFVSLHLKKGHDLRGCIGTIQPVYENIAEEIIQNAISAGTKDSRFLPVTKEELANLEIKVDVLSRPEKIKGRNELDPKKYGVIVRTKDGRTGLLLPDLEGIREVKEQLAIASQKAGINPETDEFEILKFTVTRHQ